ncbi:MAG: phosphate ABC transporter substrate-binding protein PstS [Acidimicrobiales bacterium]
MLLGLALVGAACGDDSGTDAAPTTQANGTATTAAGVTTTKPAEVTGTLNGSGATFPKAFYDEMIVDFKKAQPKATVNYAGGGSGKGRTDLQGGVVDFAGSDGLVAAADVSKYKGAFVYVPTVSAPITVSYNLSGVDNLQLSPETIAKIFQREIKTWDDPAIIAENAAVKDKLKGNIVVAHRSDGSGTTENFTIFLDKSVGAGGSGIWKLKRGSTVEWPADTQAGNGNTGVAQIVKSTAGAIGYIDLSDAKASALKYASIKNKAGKYVQPTLEATSAAVEGATVNADLSYDPLWADGDKAYPIAAPTWILVYVDQTDKVKGETIKAFLRFMLTDGQKVAPTIDYAPLSSSLTQKALAQLDKIKLPV